MLHLKIIGILLILLGLMHLAFPKYFRWKQELGSLSLINRQMMVIHTFFVALVVFLMGLLCLLNPDDLENTALGKSVSLGLAIFWIFRLLIQFFGYSPLLWKGRRFETSVHIIFSIFWIYVSSVFLIISFG